MGEQKRLIKNTGIIAIGNLSTKLVTFLLLPLYTSLLTTSEYGIVDYVISISTFIVPVISLLMDESMFRFLIDCKNEQEKTKVISTAMQVIVLNGTIFLVVALVILNVIHYEYTMYMILYVMSSVLFTMLCAFLRGIGRTDKYAVLNFLAGSLKIVLNVFFIASLRWGIEGMLLASILSQFGTSIIFGFTCGLWKNLTFRRFDVKLVKEMIVYSIPLIPNKISWSIINLSDRVITMHCMGSNATGLYAISHKFPTLMDTVYGFFYQAWKESSARVFGDKKQDNFYNYIYKYLKDFMYAIVLIMISFMPFAFDILINESFHEALLYVPILVIATYFSNISGFYGGIFTAYKKTSIMGVTTVAAAIINIVINLLLIRSIGLYAAALSTFVSNLVVYIYRKYKVRKYVELIEDRKKQALSIVASVLVLVMFYLQRKPFFYFGCLISILYAFFVNRDLIKVIITKMNRRKI